MVWEIQIYSHRNFGLNWSKMISTILTSFSYFPIIYPFTYFFFIFFFATMGWEHDYHCMSLSSTDTTKLIKIVFLKNGLQNAPILTKDIRCANKDQSNSKVNFAAWTLDSNNLKKMFLKSKKHSMESGKIISWKAACILWILIYLYTKPLMNNDFCHTLY